MREIRACLVGALQEAEQSSPGRGGEANVIVHQKKLFHLGMVESFCRFNLLPAKTVRLGCRVGIERRTFDLAAARPESGADHFVRIGFACNGVCPWAFRRTPPGEARYAEIEASPEKIYRTVLADKAGAKFLEDIAKDNQYPPEAMRVCGII